VELIAAIVEMKRRNPRFGCVRIARQICHAFGIEIDKDVVRRVLAKHHRPDGYDVTGPSWLTFVGHLEDSLWSADLFCVDSILLRSHWGIAVMDVFTRRIIGFRVAPAYQGLSQLYRACDQEQHLTSAARDTGSLPASTEVMIVGAGPTDLVVASILVKRGIPFLVVDKLAERGNASRACVVHARTLEVLEELAVTGRMRTAGHVVPIFTIRDRDRVFADVRFDRLPTRYPYTLMIPQNVTEALLLQHLREMGGEVHRPYAVTDLRQETDSVAVTVAVGERVRTVRARYVIGADGLWNAGAAPGTIRALS